MRARLSVSTEPSPIQCIYTYCTSITVLDTFATSNDISLPHFPTDGQACLGGTSDARALLLGCHTTFAIVYLCAARLGRSGMSTSESPPSSSVRAGGGGDLGRDLRPLKDPLDDVAAKSKSFPGECSSDCGDLSRALPPLSESPLCWAGTSRSLFTNTLLGVTNKGKDHGAHVSTRDARAASIPSRVGSPLPTPS